jgi:hypothetical protein
MKEPYTPTNWNLDFIYRMSEQGVFTRNGFYEVF